METEIYSLASINGKTDKYGELHGEAHEVSIQHPYIIDGHEHDDKLHHSWLNWASITKSERYDELYLNVSIADPRGSIGITIRRTDDGELLLFTPTEDEHGHVKIKKLGEGRFKLGH
tara:strand:- start:390 stop:740 length:351 start_codon:yes stop_codon:yes gene_type:complete